MNIFPCLSSLSRSSVHPVDSLSTAAQVRCFMGTVHQHLLTPTVAKHVKRPEFTQLSRVVSASSLLHRQSPPPPVHDHTRPHAATSRRMPCFYPWPLQSTLNTVERVLFENVKTTIPSCLKPSRVFLSHL